MAKFKLIVLLISMINILSGCNTFKAWFVREFRQDTLADATTRLAIPHLSMIVKEVLSKFDESHAIVTVKKISDGEGSKESGKGQVTKTINNVVIDYKNKKIVHEDCQGQRATWQGKVVIISATFSAEGYLTNDLKNPVVPDPGSVQIHVHARVENLAINFLGKGGYLKIVEGELEYTFIPRLATTQKGFMKGFRATETYNSRFENVRLSNIKAILYSDQLTMPIDLQLAELFAQVGIGEDGLENVLSGKVILFDNPREVPADGFGLDPNYNRDDFLKTFSCHNDLNGQVTYEHEPFEKKLALPMAGLSALVLGEIANVFEDNSQCGMAHPAVLKKTSFTNKEGSYGEVSNQTVTPCEIHFTEHTSKPDCFGEAYVINGSVRVLKGTKTITGLIVSNPVEYQKAILLYEQDWQSASNPDAVAQVVQKKPVAALPSLMQSATIDLDVEFNGITLKKICVDVGTKTHAHHCQNATEQSDNQINFTIFSGQAHAVFKPLLAKQLDPKIEGAGFCSVPTPVSEAHLTLTKVKAEIARQGSSVPALVTGSFTMINGKIGKHENQLRGYLQVGQQMIQFSDKTRGYSRLNPEFDPRTFADSYLSCQNVEVPKQDKDCQPGLGLASNLARLLVMNAGALLKVSQKVEGGFASKYAVDRRELENNETRLMLPAQLIKPLDLNNDVHAELRSIDMGGGVKLLLSGRVNALEGKLTRDGIRLNPAKMIGGVNLNPLSGRYIEAILAKIKRAEEVYVRPIKPESTLIHLSSDVQDFSTKRMRPNQKSIEPYLWFRSGNFKVNATPLFGLDERTINDEYPSYSISTPIVRFDRIDVTNATVVMRGNGFFLPIHISKAELQAFNGKYQGQGNFIEGKIFFQFDGDGEDDQFAVSFPAEPLDPKFDQATFNAGYASQPYLHAVLPED